MAEGLAVIFNATIYLSRAGMDDWQWLYASQPGTFNDVIYRWDTTLFADDLYDLRLRIVYQDSNYDEYYVSTLRVTNDRALLETGPTLALNQPAEGALVVGQVDIGARYSTPVWVAGNSTGVNRTVPPQTTNGSGCCSILAAIRLWTI